MIILGFDCANKSLGVTIAMFNKQYKDDINKYILKKITQIKNKKILNTTHPIQIDLSKVNPLLNAKNNINYTFNRENIDNSRGIIIKLNKKIDNSLNIVYVNVFDLIPNIKIKDSTLLDRTISLKKILNNLDDIINTYNDKLELVLIEYQMNLNDKSRDISGKIMYHYCNNITNNIKLIGPSLKQKISFNEKLHYNHYIQRYNSLYRANKKHSADNFLHWINLFNKNDLIKHIKNKNIDDAADSFIMIYAYLKKYNYI